MRNNQKSILIHAIMTLLLSPLFFGSPFLQGKEQNQTKKLRQEIIGLNLINGIELSPEQMGVILQSAEESQSLQEDFQKSLQTLGEVLETELEKIKSCLVKNQDIPPSTAQNFHRISNEIKRKTRETEEKMGRLVRKVEENLEQHQIHQLNGFIPCIIPPKGELRIGQAGDNKGLVRNLEKIREIPYKVYQRRKGEIINRTWQKMELHMPRGVEIEKSELKQHIQNVFRRVRILSDTDFEIRKAGLAEELIFPIKPSQPNHDTTKMIETFLLHPEIIPILEERLLSFRD
jgi:hypothetical protein